MKNLRLALKLFQLRTVTSTFINHCGLLGITDDFLILLLKGFWWYLVQKGDGETMLTVVAFGLLGVVLGMFFGYDFAYGHLFMKATFFNHFIFIIVSAVGGIIFAFVGLLIASLLGVFLPTTENKERIPVFGLRHGRRARATVRTTTIINSDGSTGVANTVVPTTEEVIHYRYDKGGVIYQDSLPVDEVEIQEEWRNNSILSITSYRFVWRLVGLFAFAPDPDYLFIVPKGKGIL